MNNIVNNIIDFEAGLLDEQSTIDLFQVLIDTGMVWKLQGFYGRMAVDLIERGLCNDTFNIISNVNK